MNDEVALMALGLGETMVLAKAMHMPKETLMKELKELSDYSLEHPIFITEPQKWVRMNALFRAAIYRKLLKTSVPPLSCRQQIMIQRGRDGKYTKEDG